MLNELIEKIGLFYYEKNNQNYKLAKQEVENLQITNLDLDEDDKLSITLRRPGILIGPKGENIYRLTDYLNVYVRIVEDTQDNYCDRIINSIPIGKY